MRKAVILPAEDKSDMEFRRTPKDEAVSPVIAVILMVAITVVLAATVYVWVSGFSANGSQPSKTLALTSNGALSGGIKTYTIASATSGMRWSDITITVNGVTRAFDSTGTCPSTPSATTVYLACAGSTIESSNGNTMTAGKAIALSGVSAGQTLRVLDVNANSVILTLTIG